MYRTYRIADKIIMFAILQYYNITIYLYQKNKAGAKNCASLRILSGIFNISLSGCKSCNRNSERRTAYIC